MVPLLLLIMIVFELQLSTLPIRIYQADFLDVFLLTMNPNRSQIQKKIELVHQTRYLLKTNSTLK